MGKRRKEEALIASAVYDDLTGEEQRRLEALLDAHPERRAELDALRATVAAVPRTQPSLGMDLVPVLQRRIAEGVARRTWGMRQWALVGSACALLLVAFLVMQPGESPVSPPLQAVEPGARPSPVHMAIAQAKGLVEDGEYVDAYKTLETAVASWPEEPAAGNAQLMLADVAYTHLRWYDKADKAYRDLAMRYPEVAAGDVQCAQRRNVLDEASRVDYASLHALDAARSDRTGSLDKFAEVIKSHPGTYVASLAASDMAETMMRDEGRMDADSATAMAKARDLCSDPVVVAQLNLEIGHIHRDKLHDFKRARDYYQKAAEHPVLAKRATDALASLDSAGVMTR